MTRDEALNLLKKQVEAGKEIQSKNRMTEAQEKGWSTRTRHLLEVVFGPDSTCVREFDKATNKIYAGTIFGESDREVKRLKRLAVHLSIIENMLDLKVLPEKPGQPAMTNKVFLVHGHHEAMNHETARFLEKMDLEVVMLREKPNEGRTIIQKFEDYSDVSFAVVLLTADDRGGVATAPLKKQQLRARQNVIFELGFFLAKLGRAKVAALYQDKVEILSDFSGVLFIPIDGGGAWKTGLAREIKAAKLPIDLNTLV